MPLILSLLGSRWKEIQKKSWGMLVLRHYHHNVQYYVSHSPLTLVRNTQKTSFSIIRLKFVLLFNWKRNSHFKAPLRRWKCWLDIEHHPSTHRYALVHAMPSSRLGIWIKFIKRTISLKNLSTPCHASFSIFIMIFTKKSLQ